MECVNCLAWDLEKKKMLSKIPYKRNSFMLSGIFMLNNVVCFSLLG